MAIAKVLPLTKKFLGTTERAATEAAKRWSADLTSHDAIRVESIETAHKGTGKYFATITYRE